MIILTSVSGNIWHDTDMKDATLERIHVSRMEMGKKRVRKTTDRGTDVGILLEGAATLRHGDIVTDGRHRMVIEQLPEKVVSVRLEPPYGMDLPVMLGHTLGNRHRPVSIRDDIVSFPIQSDSELEVFERLFACIPGRVELSIREMIFQPQGDASDHG